MGSAAAAAAVDVEADGLVALLEPAVAEADVAPAAAAACEEYMGTGCDRLKLARGLLLGWGGGVTGDAGNTRHGMRYIFI